VLFVWPVLRDMRQGRSLSQEESGFKSGSPHVYRAVGRGEKSPSLRTIFNLTATLEISPLRLSL